MHIDQPVVLTIRRDAQLGLNELRYGFDELRGLLLWKSEQFELNIRRGFRAVVDHQMGTWIDEHHDRTFGFIQHVHQQIGGFVQEFSRMLGCDVLIGI